MILVIWLFRKYQVFSQVSNLNTLVSNLIVSFVPNSSFIML